MIVKEIANGVQRGMQFSRWLVLGKPFSVGGSQWRVVVRCECGKVATARCHVLARGRTLGCQSCCKTTHGGKQTRLCGIWRAMKHRCYHPGDKHFKDYGVRGITVYFEWRDSFETFRDWATANGYADGLQIDRIDNDGNYEPGNCRWVTARANGRNRRSNVKAVAWGETKTLIEWIEDSRCIVKYTTLRARILRGWDVERAITARV